METRSKLFQYDMGFEGKALALLKTKSFSRAPGEPLDSPAFPDTFAPSAFHGLVRSLVRQTCVLERVERWAGSDWAYRHVDLEKVGVSQVYLSAFKMLVFLEAVSQKMESECRERTLDHIMALIGLMKKKPRDLFVSYFAGCPEGITSEVKESAIRALWTKRGVPGAQLVAIRGTANLTNVLRVGEPAGPRCEIFLRSDVDAFIEVGTVVFERFLLESTNPLTLCLAPSVVCGAAIGVERAEMVSSGARSLFELPQLRAGIDAAKQGLPRLVTDIQADNIRRLVDAVRSTLVILEKSSVPRSSSRAGRIAKLRRVVLRAAAQLGCRDVSSLVKRVAAALQPFCCAEGSACYEEQVWKLLVG